MLKITGLPNEPAPSKNNNSRSISSRNNNNRPAFGRNNGDKKVYGYGVSENDVEYAKKSGKLSKSGKSKNKKTSKSQNLAKSGKKLLKSENSTNFDIMEDRPKFLNLNARIVFNRLRLAFTEAPIL